MIGHSNSVSDDLLMVDNIVIMGGQMMEEEILQEICKTEIVETLVNTCTMTEIGEIGTIVLKVSSLIQMVLNCS